jgi:hypothetical protein
MDIRFEASLWVWNEERGAVQSQRYTHWRQRNAPWIPRVGDSLREDGFAWWNVTQIVFDRTMELITVTLEPDNANEVSQPSEWEQVLRSVGDREQLGLSPLTPLAAKDGAVHTKLRAKSKLEAGIVGHLRPEP